MRPMLRPGCHVLRRDARDLQVGLDPRDAVVLPDREDVRRCLDRLRVADERPADPARTADRGTLDVLATADLLVDADRVLPLMPAASAAGDRAVPRADVAALVRRSGEDAADLLTARTGARIGVAAFGPVGAERLGDDLRALLGRAGIRTHPVGVPGARPRAAPGAVVLVGVGEPHRELLDGWVRDGVPHLVVRLAEGVATLGPFVVPGRTACLRCVDAHHTDADPAWPLLVEQYARASGRDRCDGVPEPVDALSAAVATAWAARDVASYVEGHQPSTWSGTIRLDPRLDSVETRTWPRHAECGCGWD